MADAKPSTPTPEETIARAVSHAGPDALRDITPLVMGIGVSSGFDLEDPLTLLQPIARVTPKVHPLLDALLSLAGARKMGTRSYAFATGRGSDPEGLVMFLNALPAGMVRQHGMVWDYPSHSFRYDDSPGYKLTYLRTGGYHRTLPSSWMSDAALDAAMMRHEVTHPNGALSRMCVTLDPGDKQLFVRFITRGLIYDPTKKASCSSVVSDLSAVGALDLGLFGPTDRKDPVKMLPAQAVGVAEWLAAAGYLVADLNKSGTLVDMRNRVRRSVVAAPVPGAPALAELSAGADLDIPAAGAPRRGSAMARATVDAGTALDTISAVQELALEDPSMGIAAAVDSRVADVGRMLLAEPVANPLLRPYQQEAVGVQCATELGLLNALAPGLGKGQPVDSKVLTPSGWMRIGDVAVGDSLIGSDGKPIAVTGVFPRGELDVFKVNFSDGSSLVVDGDHLWAVRRKGSDNTLTPREQAEKAADKTRISSTGYGASEEQRLTAVREVLAGSAPTKVAKSSGVSITSVCNWVKRYEEDGFEGLAYRHSAPGPWRVMETREIMGQVATPNGELVWRIPMAQPVHFSSSSSVPVPAYTLGVLLGDGSLTRPGVVSFSSADEEVHLEVDRDLKAAFGDEFRVHTVAGSKYHERTPEYSIRGERSVNRFRVLLADLGVMGLGALEKLIPASYLIAGVEDRLALLQGLMDTDGGTEQDGKHLSFSSSSLQLAEGVRELVESLGGVARLRERKAPTYTHNGEKRTGATSYRLTLQLPAGLRPFRLPRKADSYKGRSVYTPTRIITSIEPAGRSEVVCLQVDAPDHLYVTERYIVTHNTVVTLTGMRMKAAKLIEEGKAYHGLVAVPAAIRMQWSHEATTWFPEAEVVCVRTGKDAERLSDAIAEAGTSKPVVVVTSYQMLAGVADLIDPAYSGKFSSVRAYLDARDEMLPEDSPAPADLSEIFSRISWTDLVCDEAALVLRNPGAKRYQALWEMRGNSKVALALTGTPIDKSLDDLGRLLSWVRNDADLFYGKRLSERYDVLDKDSLIEYSKAIGPLMFRRDRSEVADELPEVATEVVLLEGRKEELALANAARTELKKIYQDLMEKMTEAEALHPSDPRFKDAKESLAAARGAMLGGVTLARMAASDPAAVAGSESAGAMLLKSKGLVAAATKHPGTKRAQIVDLTVDLVARGEQVLIFTDFSSVAENLVADFKERGEAVGAVLGGQSDKVRDAAVTGYQKGALKILVATSAAREGMNLQATTTLIHYDLPWSPSMVVQRMARANRIGAKAKTLQVLIPVMAGTIEERVSSLLVARAATAMSALDSSRGIDVKGTEIGLALGGLVESANEGELKGNETSLLEMARSILS